jgi:hypothetical protein
MTHAFNRPKGPRPYPAVSALSGHPESTFGPTPTKPMLTPRALLRDLPVFCASCGVPVSDEQAAASEYLYYHDDCRPQTGKTSVSDPMPRTPSASSLMGDGHG